MFESAKNSVFKSLLDDLETKGYILICKAGVACIRNASRSLVIPIVRDVHAGVGRGAKGLAALFFAAVNGGIAAEHEDTIGTFLSVAVRGKHAHDEWDDRNGYLWFLGSDISD